MLPPPPPLPLPQCYSRLGLSNPGLSFEGTQERIESGHSRHLNMNVKVVRPRDVSGINHFWACPRPLEKIIGVAIGVQSHIDERFNVCGIRRAPCVTVTKNRSVPTDGTRGFKTAQSRGRRVGAQSHFAPDGTERSSAIFEQNRNNVPVYVIHTENIAVSW